MGVEVEVEVVVLLNEWTREMDTSQIWKPGWGLGMVLTQLPF
jgi:hypothetical protein